MYRLIFLILFASLFLPQNGFCTHNRAGEITYVQLGPLTIEATITTYTKTSSAGADRDSLLIFWGDGSEDLLIRVNGNGDELPGEDIKINYYKGSHTYPGRGTYTLAFQDPNRVNNIQNVNYPNSVDIPFYVQTRFTLIESQFQGPNNSVVLLQPPIDFACVGQRFVHNPNAFDPDGDSISYSLIVPLQGEGDVVPKYFFPDEISPGLDNSMTMDPLSGNLVWDAPPTTGEFNVAILISEYRNGVLLNTVIRDMQILVQSCSDNPPEIESIDEICVVAGTQINIPIIISDQDPGQKVRISATGGPFIQPFSPAIVQNQNTFLDAPLTSNFIWETKCEHISDNPYLVIIRGQDDSRMGITGNAVLKNIKIKVVGPPPENVNTEVQNDESILITWDRDYACENTINDYFIGFRIYRKENTNPFEIDTCTAGLAGKGYKVIKFLTNETLNDNQYFHIDDTVEKGKIYCYRVLANFASRTSTGQPFNIIESLASEEKCIQLNLDLPLITKVSVVETDVSDGQIQLDWIRPSEMDLDTNIFQGPYQYDLYRSEDNNTFNLITRISTPFFNEDYSLQYIDDNINTVSKSYTYRVDFLSQENFYSASPAASSVFASLISTDRKNEVSCAEVVPWNNFSYILYIEEPIGSGTYEELSESESCNFDHNNLENNTNYCYVIESIGTYGLGETPDSIRNFSQRICGIPVDTMGPCPPIIAVQNPCEDLELGLTNIDFTNLVTWENNFEDCEILEFIKSFKVYYKRDSTSQFELISEEANSIFEFNHLPENGINGCYAVTAIDSLGNEGPLSNTICVENCPIYELPNTFTPNDDGANDLYIPRENLFVDAVDFKVFNRWGNKVFETEDPSLLWDGRDLKGNDLPSGTYYYTCKVQNIINQELNDVSLLQGYVQILK